MKEFKPVFLIISGLVVIHLTVSGISCGKPSVTGPIKAQVLTIVPKTSGEELGKEPKYQIKEVTFSHLDNLDDLVGKYYTFYSGGSLELRVKGSTVTPVETNVAKPALHYEVKNNVVIPKDNYTLLILSSAFQLDYIFSNLEQFSSVNPDEILEKKGKLKVYFDTTMTISSGKKTETLDHNNAAFARHIYSFITLKTNKNEKIPLSTNLNVISHEFGHLLFEHLTSNSDSDSKLNKLPSKAAVIATGLNEGFADLTAYALTGNSNALSGSFETEGESEQPALIRQRDFTSVKFDYSSAVFTSEGVSFDGCDHDFYCIGTLFDNAFYKTQVSQGHDLYTLGERAKAYKLITQAMKAFRNTSENISESGDEFISKYLEILLNNISDANFSSELRKNLKLNFPNSLN
jgi:hypothetical protein